jgi:hypothetical protein
MNPANNRLALQRWLRIALGLRLAYNPGKPSVIALWLRLGRRLCGAGLLDERDMLQRSLRLLWQCAEDPALPWIWRCACWEHAVRPMARYATLQAWQDPLGVLLWERRLALTGERLCTAPSLQGACRVDR